MKSIFLSIAALAIAGLLVLAGCASLNSKNDQQAVYATGASIGVALVAANAYQALNSCSKPAHTLPCSDDNTVAKIQTAKVQLVAAHKQADAVVNDPAYTADKFTKATLILNTALSLLVSITPPSG